jgi:hypothetical protein
MSDDAHNVSLLPLLVNRVTHGFTVNGEALVFLPKRRIPFLESPIKFNRVNADQDVTDARFTGYEIAAPFLSATAKAFSGLGAEIISPTGNGLVTPHAA